MNLFELLILGLASRTRCSVFETLAFLAPFGGGMMMGTDLGALFAVGILIGISFANLPRS